ncbi:ABC transporter ATP-binding protein [Bosea sp. (in: a-proteobacteria)]|uniref:ABC transporter ATP-binding protein n=1 Tax=Bosea sp. (in: a-proteobacteria) TaxID=1871050 RepID=UPI00262C7440|nr:ABC transporter ATP-binding protein [Bosea sp. (in: a-proteobacteria)]MCO5090216.1 ABC transporter ATP-binding protein [Bosea sp. (in: a-proteobacteria)]
MAASLDVSDLRKDYVQGKPVVDHVSFHVPAGEIIVLLGSSGCGKTTTLRCIAGLEHPTAGRISIGGQTVSSPAEGILLPPRSREIGMVFQSYAVWPHMSVRQNVMYPLKRRGVSRDEAERRVKEALDLVDLGAYADRSVVALSGGQMQRVALARSLSYRPQLLLLDEPLSNLDAKLRLRLRDDLRRIIKQTGTTALYVTHDQAEATALGDRIGVMHNGRLLQLAPPEQVYSHPAALFIANFTGATNMVQARVRSRQAGGCTLELSGGRTLSASMPSPIGEGAGAVVAFRPESVRLSRASSEHSLPGTIVEKRYQGVQTAYRIKMFDEILEAVEVGSELGHDVGQDVNVSIPQQHCWAYERDKDSYSLLAE